MTTDTISITAQPEPITIELSRTAVLVVDMQNDFGAKGGMFDRAGIDISSIQEVVGPICSVLAFARQAGLKVIYLQHGHPLGLCGKPTANYSRCSYAQANIPWGVVSDPPRTGGQHHDPAGR